MQVQVLVLTTLGNAICSVTRLWFAPGVTSMRYEVLLAGVEEPEQASPAPPANRTCIYQATPQVADGTSVQAWQGRFDRDVG